MSNDIAGLKAKTEHKRRPVVHTKIIADTGRDYVNSGVELVLTKHGIECYGFYDSFVGIQGFRMTWDEFDAARREVVGKHSEET